MVIGSLLIGVQIDARHKKTNNNKNNGYAHDDYYLARANNCLNRCLVFITDSYALGNSFEQ